MYYHVHLDPAFTPSESAIILESLDAWRSKVPVRFDVEVSYCTDENNEQICMHPGDPAMHGGNPGSGGCTKNATDLIGPIDGHEVWLTPQTDLVGRPYLFENMTLHEIGHAMGLVHSGPGTIMCFEAGCEPQPGYVTDNDVDQWLEIRR